MKITDKELNEALKSGRKIFYDRISWAKTYLKKAGLLEYVERGKFRITEEGIKLLQKNPKVIDNKLLLNYEGFKEFYQGSNNLKNRNDNILTKIKLHKS
ncbi:winged helix-turn-helix domain-containing protein [Marinitoga lauensis]|uniref:winged helix-turn-helix domain-containing protein n=1 Tax=Marinitoga lauensis TaxID=2201189 RepID=UPI0019809691|nr:winged helix-turn-helix domain-containing protein [Marinitoga lauensis]